MLYVLLYLGLIVYGVVVHTEADGMVSDVVCVLLYLPLTDRLWCGCTHSSGWNGLWCCLCYCTLD